MIIMLRYELLTCVTRKQSLQVSFSLILNYLAGNNFIRVPGLSQEIGFPIQEFRFPIQEIGFPIQEIGFPIQETEAGRAPYSGLQYSIQNFVQQAVSTYHTVVTDVTGAVSVHYEMKSTYEAETVVTVPSEQSQPLEQSYTQEEFHQLSTNAFECSLEDVSLYRNVNT